MIYARINNGVIESRDDSWDGFDLQKAQNEGFTGFDVPGAEYLYIDSNGNIAQYTSTQVANNQAAEVDAEKTERAAIEVQQAFALVVLDRVNAINAAINATNSAVNAATAGTANATNLKTDYPQYTQQQMINAVKAKL